MKKCSNCKNRFWHGMFGMEMCMIYEMALTEEDEINGASECSRYKEEDDDYFDEYTPSSTYGDYSPSNPWDAPGMSIRDFI